MTEAEAAWVREHVWPRWMRDAAVQVPSLTRCACSVCGYCSMDQHDQCYLVRYEANGIAADYVRRGIPATWVYRTTGEVVDPVRAAVFEVGHTHGAWCTCHRAGHPGRPEREPDLLDLLREAA